MKKKDRATECAVCDIGPLTRNNYFTGKLLVERDFKDEQRYYIDKLRLHQKRLHGEGVVCGLEVVQHPNPACRDRDVCVKPGFAKDCCGNDILMLTEDCIDITQFEAWKKLKNDPEASRRFHHLQICIRYKECPTESIPVLYDECGCDDSACAPNRILETYELDLMVDQPIVPPKSCLPTLIPGPGDRGSITINNPRAVALEPASGLLYLLGDAGAGATLYQMDASRTKVQAQAALPGPGKSIAFSDDGTRVFVAALNKAGTGSALLVFDAKGLKLTGTSPDVADTAASPLTIAALPQAGNLVAWLQAQGAQFILWDVSAANPAQASTLALTGTPASLTLGADRTTAYFVDTSAPEIGVIDIAANALRPSLKQVAGPSRLTLGSAASPDVLIVAEETNHTLTALQTNPSRTIGVLALEDSPVEMIASPDKRVLFVVTKSTTDFALQPADLKKLVSGSPQAPGAAVPVDAPAGAAATDGATVFLPVQNANSLAPSVTVIAADKHLCPDLHSVDDCIDCDKPDCLVLATILRYRPGFLIEDQTDPPSDPAADVAAHIARIDNRLGRTVLPSTAKIAEVLECLIDCCGCGGGTGTQGPKGDSGPAGPQGPAGPGFNPNLPKIIDIAWTHKDIVPWTKFRNSVIYATHPQQVKANFLGGKGPLPLLTIYFNEVMAGVDRQTFRVEITYPQMQDGKLFQGVYNQPRILIYGFPLDLGPLPTPHTSEAAKSAWTFIPYREFFVNPVPQLTHMWEGNQNYIGPADLKLDLPCLRATLSGDFIFSPDSGGNYDEQRMLDGDNIGGRVGFTNPPFPRGGPITGGKNPSGDMDEGGDFESWLFLGPPENAIGLNPVNVNKASLDQLQTLPGIDAAAAKKIVAERKKSSLANGAALQSRVGLSEEAAATLDGLIDF